MIALIWGRKAFIYVCMYLTFFEYLTYVFVQTIMTKGFNESGIAIKKNENSEKNAGDLHVANKSVEEAIQVCENMGDTKQELEPENVEKACESASGDNKHMMVPDTKATYHNSSGDGLTMDETLGALSTMQAFFQGNSQIATGPEDAEEKIYEKINENTDHDKHIGGYLEMVAQKDIHKIIEDKQKN